MKSFEEIVKDNCFLLHEAQYNGGNVVGFKSEMSGNSGNIIKTISPLKDTIIWNRQQGKVWVNGVLIKFKDTIIN